jgi:hypothetical protein
VASGGYWRGSAVMVSGLLVWLMKILQSSSSSVYKVQIYLQKFCLLINLRKTFSHGPAAAMKILKYQSGIHGGLEAVLAQHDYSERLQESDDFEGQAAQKGANFSTQYSHGFGKKSVDRDTGKSRRWRKRTIVLAVLLAVMIVAAIAIGAALGLQKSHTSRYVEI